MRSNIPALSRKKKKSTRIKKINEHQNLPRSTIASYSCYFKWSRYDGSKLHHRTNKQNQHTYGLTAASNNKWQLAWYLQRSTALEVCRKRKSIGAYFTSYGLMWVYPSASSRYTYKHSCPERIDPFQQLLLTDCTMASGGSSSSSFHNNHNSWRLKKRQKNKNKWRWFVVAGRLRDWQVGVSRVPECLTKLYPSTERYTVAKIAKKTPYNVSFFQLRLIGPLCRLMQYNVDDGRWAGRDGAA